MLTIIAVGTIKEPSINASCDHYLTCLKRSYKTEVHTIKPSTNPDAHKQRTEESERILKVLDKATGTIIVLDERGKAINSPALAKLVQQAKDYGQQLTFVVGGAFGMDDAVRAKADKVIKLSDCVFPHELFRLMLLEQLYRAGEINRGSQYHHDL
jgi:23S rRNA (pseudouridine1915-N3)-methyltransferase